MIWITHVGRSVTWPSAAPPCLAHVWLTAVTTGIAFTYLRRGKIATISQMTFSTAFSWIDIAVLIIGIRSVFQTRFSGHLRCSHSLPGKGAYNRSIYSTKWNETRKFSLPPPPQIMALFHRKFVVSMHIMLSTIISCRILNCRTSLKPVVNQLKRVVWFSPYQNKSIVQVFQL